MPDDTTTLDRRSFIRDGARAAAGAAKASTAVSYARILGANDRISLGQIGIGNRGSGLAGIVGKLKDAQNVEVTAVCDLWTVNRQKAADLSAKYYGRPPRTLAHPEELLGLKDVDAVIIATPEHSHSPVLKLAVEADKDAYCEKPMGNVLEEVKAARDAVLAPESVVPMGAQARSGAYPRPA